MKHIASILGVVLAAQSAMSLHGQSPKTFNEDESKVGAYSLPDPLLCQDGSRVKDVPVWQSKRRGEILRSFAKHMYGLTPVPPQQLRGQITASRTDAVGGLATRRLITLRCFDDPAAPCIHLMLYVPNGASKPAPVFLGLNYWGNASVEADPDIPLSDRWMRPSTETGIVNNRATEATRGAHAERWPLALALTRGYAVATFFMATSRKTTRRAGRTAYAVTL
jgi:hypothetical protein